MQELNLGRVRGTTIYTGGTITGTSSEGRVFLESGITKAYAGDIYINTDVVSESKGNVYLCVSGGGAEEAEWGYDGNIKGPQVEIENSLDSGLITRALSAYQGNVLKNLILDSGCYTKEILTCLEDTVYSVKLVIENVDTTISLALGENVVEESYVKSGESAERTLVIALGEKSGVLTKITSSAAFIKSYTLFDEESNEIYSEVLNVWSCINKLQMEIEPSGSIVDGEKSVKVATLWKFLRGVREKIYPVTHAKAVWFDEKENKTVYDVVYGMTETDTKDNTTTFESGDVLEPAAFADVELLASGEKHSSILAKVSLMFKNVRRLIKLVGTTDISAIGDGTLTGAASTLNSNNMNEVTGVYNISSDIVVEASDSYTGFTVDNLLSYKYLFIRSNLGGEYVIPISFLKYRGYISLSFHRQQYEQYVASHFCDVRIDTNSNWIGIKHMGVYVKGWSNADIIMEMNLYK